MSRRLPLDDNRVVACASWRRRWTRIFGRVRGWEVLALQQAWLGVYVPQTQTRHPVLQAKPAHAQRKSCAVPLRVRDGRPVGQTITGEVRQLLASNPGRAFMLGDIMAMIAGNAQRFEVTPVLAKLHDRGQVKRGTRFNGRRMVNVWQWVTPAEQSIAA